MKVNNFILWHAKTCVGLCIVLERMLLTEAATQLLALRAHCVELLLYHAQYVDAYAIACHTHVIEELPRATQLLALCAQCVELLAYDACLTPAMSCLSAL